MEKQDEILSEVKALRKLIAKIIGTSDLPQAKQFSKSAIEKAAAEFQSMQIERGEWVNQYDIHKVIRNFPYAGTKFLIDELKFQNYFRRGQRYYFNRKDLIALGKELKERNLNLGRYLELKSDKAKFDVYIAKIISNPKKLPYVLAEDMKDVSTSNPPRPSVKLIREHLNALKKDFEEYKMSEYIDVYNDSYAMLKDYYRFRKYVDSDLKRRITKWKDDFNTANQLLHEFGYRRKKKVE